MKIISLISAFICFTICTQAQLTMLPSGENKKAMVRENIGITEVTITYNRPGVKAREGHIWGELVHKGFIDQGIGTSVAAPWRAGANENTTIEFSTDVMVNGNALLQGKYGLFIAFDSTESIIIFSKNADAWGSYFYDAKDDALRIKVKPERLNESIEWLTYEFIQQTPTSATIALKWENLMLPFTVSVDYIQTQLASFRRELQTGMGFNWQPWQQAAQFTLDNNINLEEGLLWADYALNARYVGEKNFKTLSTKAQLLQKLNRGKEADSLMKEAMPLANENEMHAYGRQLISQGDPLGALEIFKKNYAKNPDSFTTLVGLARGYAALGKFDDALKHAQSALLKAPDANNKTSVEQMISKLKEKKDINN